MNKIFFAPSVSKTTSPQCKFHCLVQPLRPNCKILFGHRVFRSNCGELVPKSFSKRKSISSSERAVSADLGRVCKWLWTNQLTLNVLKSKFMLIGSSFRLSKVGSIRIAAVDPPLDNVNSNSYLGIVINNQFSWCDHTESVHSKISKKLGLLRRMKSCLPLSARVTFLMFLFYLCMIMGI